MEESEELTRVAQEITGTEATYGEMQKSCFRRDLLVMMLSGI